MYILGLVLIQMCNEKRHLGTSRHSKLQMRSAKTVYCQVHTRLVRRWKIVQHNMPYVAPYSRILGRIPVNSAVQWLVNCGQESGQERSYILSYADSTQHNGSVLVEVFRAGSVLKALLSSITFLSTANLW